MPVNTGILRGLDQGHLAKSVAGAVDVTLSGDEARNQVIVFSGAITASINVNFPVAAETAGVIWFLDNDTTGAFTLTVKGTIGTGLAIAQGKQIVAEWTGADFVAWTAEL